MSSDPTANTASQALPYDVQLQASMVIRQAVLQVVELDAQLELANQHALALGTRKRDLARLIASTAARIGVPMLPNSETRIFFVGGYEVAANEQAVHVRPLIILDPEPEMTRLTMPPAVQAGPNDPTAPQTSP